MTAKTEYQKALARLRREAKREARPDRPETLRLEELAVCPEVFQPRIVGGGDGLDQRHIEALVAALDSKPADKRVLDPITVYAIRDRFYVLDGHHRYAAYREAGVEGAVPVRHFEGSFEDALCEPLLINSKVHLNMTREARNEAAWRLVVRALRYGEKWLKGPKIVEASGLSIRSVKRMRELYRRLVALDDEAFAADWTDDAPLLPENVWEDYREALRHDPEDTSSQRSDMWMDAMTAQWVDRFGTAFGDEAHKHPGIFAEALSTYLGEHALQRVAEELAYFPFDPEEYETFLEWKRNRAMLTAS